MNSVETKTRKDKFEQFGRKEALDTIFSVLWSMIIKNQERTK